jgi:imidazoleglycerol phosphate dehydratase HisB
MALQQSSILSLVSTPTQAEQQSFIASLTAEQRLELSTQLQSLVSLVTSFQSAPKGRTATVTRSTKETTISVRVDLDGSGKSEISTGIGFLDHMFTALSKHSMIDIYLQCKGDLEVDDHHTSEDCALALGAAIDDALGRAKTGIQRYGYAYAPLDESLARAVVDLSGRPSAQIDLKFVRERVGSISTEMLTHVFQSLAMAAKMTLHVTVIEGANDHHKSEAAFKALALALRQAISIDSRRLNDVPSTKGSL